MPIRDFSSGSERRVIGWIGTQPSTDEESLCAGRGYNLYPFTSSSLTDLPAMSVLDSVIFSQRPGSPTQVVLDLERYAQQLLDNDTRVYVRVATSDVLKEGGRDLIARHVIERGLPVAGLTDEERKRIPPEKREREGFPLAPFVYICDLGHTWSYILQLIANNPAGKAPSRTIQIDARNTTGKKIDLGQERELLLRRAFHDCDALHLRQMQDGLSGVMVFRAHADLAGGNEGRWSIPFFVKIGPRSKIALEYEKYQLHALPYIPFNLGPRLLLDRCDLGAREGVIVGDFVEQTELLKCCAPGGRAAHALGNLFARTLRAWCNAARRDEERSLFECLSYLYPARIPREREELIRTLGCKLSHDQARRLLEAAGSKPILVGTIHGDLNASNVLVRANDAVVIDFEQLREGMPLVYDPACVEAGLFVDGFVDDHRELLQILESVAPLYDADHLLRWLKPCHPKDGSAWFYECVRQVRLHAQQLELAPYQYANALALAYIKKAGNEHVFSDKRDNLRALGFLIAERILEKIA